MFASKQKQIEELLGDYRKQVSLAVSGMLTTFKEYDFQGDRAELTQRITEVSSHESKADDTRREIEVMMFSKSMFPESRGEVLQLLEAIDKIANQAESVVRMLRTHNLTVPEAFRTDVCQLAQICAHSVKVLLEGEEKLYSDFTGATETLGRVDELESEADRVEQALTERIFCSDLAGWEKLVLRDLVRAIASISDRAENAGDLIRIIVAKRGI